MRRRSKSYTYVVATCSYDTYFACLALRALMETAHAVLARGILSVCLSVCPSVTFRYCVQTNEDTIVRFSASGRTIPHSASSVSLHIISSKLEMVQDRRSVTINLRYYAEFGRFNDQFVQVVD